MALKSVVSGYFWSFNYSFSPSVLGAVIEIPIFDREASDGLDKETPAVIFIIIS